MCGIAGTYNWGDSATADQMAAVQRHRGPDDGGTWHRTLPDGTFLSLASRRLAIQDLSSAGHMPMSSEDGRLVITYNGEIYNFPALRQELEAQGVRFRSHTDTEVILRLYEKHGVEMLNRLNGIFAFAICDLRETKPVLFLARDHFGVKPLYYIEREKRLAFASEVKAILQVPGIQAEIDPDGLLHYLTFLWVPDPGTAFRGIRKLPAGHYGIWRDGHLDIRQYWDLKFQKAHESAHVREEELVEQVGELLKRAVKSQMIADVPIGAFLSAGMDSSSIVALMAQATSEPVRTYTITFPERYRVGENLDDPAVARRLAERYGCDHHELVVEPKVTDLLPKLVWHMDEPTADPAIIAAYLVAREARADVTVLLSGVGGDELFAGYRKHIAAGWADGYRKVPRPLRAAFEAALARVPHTRGSRLKSVTRLIKKMSRSASLSPQDAFLMNSTYMAPQLISEMCEPEVAQGLLSFHPWDRHREHFSAAKDYDFLNQMLYLDSKAFMVSLNLTYNDKMSMASSVEARVPFLDRELAEFAARQVPPTLKLKGRVAPTTKYILRRAMQGIVPDEVLHQPKAGFAAPVDYWLAHDLQEMVHDVLSPDRVGRRGIFRPAAVSRMLNEHRSGREDWSSQIWQLLTFELWAEAFLDRAAAPRGATDKTVAVVN